MVTTAFWRSNVWPGRCNGKQIGMGLVLGVGVGLERMERPSQKCQNHLEIGKILATHGQFCITHSAYIFIGLFV